MWKAVKLLIVQDKFFLSCHSFFRLCLEWTLLDKSRCGPEGPCGDTWPRSTPCTGPRTPSESAAADLLGAGQHVGVTGRKALMGRELLTDLVPFSQTHGQCLTRWETDRVGHIHN